MKSIYVSLAVGFGALIAMGGTQAVAQPASPAGYEHLMFDRAAGLYVFRLNGVPWICPANSFCKAVHLDGVADKDLAGADIASLGFADQRYFLSFQQASHDKGRTTIFSCLDDRCTKFDNETGDAVLLDTFQVKQGNDVAGRSAILRNLDSRNVRSQLLWCSDKGCAELPATRDAELYLNFMGRGRFDNANRIWLRERAGWVMECSQGEEGVDDRLNCDHTDMAFNDFPKTAPGPAIQPVAPPPANTAETDQRNLINSLDSAIRGGDFATADQLLAEGNRRFPRQAIWTQYQNQLAQARAARDLRQRTEEARSLVAEARRFADYEDYDSAERMLQEASRVYPNFPEIGQARAEIGRERAARDQDLREQYQYTAAIDRALQNYNLWEAERLIGAARQRYPQEVTFRNYANQLAQIKAQARWQERLKLSRGYVAAARQAMDKGDFGYAERQLELADQTTPGLPEIGQARSDLSRLRVRAQVQSEDIRRLTASIDDAILRKQFDDAERLLQDGKRRYSTYGGWGEVQRDIAAARQGNDRQTRDQQERRKKALDLVASAHLSGDKGDYNGAGKLLDEAAKLYPNLPEIAVMRSDIERQQADRRRQEKEIANITASIDAALKRDRFGDAEQQIQSGAKRFPDYKGWDELRKRVADAKKATDGKPDRQDQQNAAKIRELLGAVQQAMAQGKLNDAEAALKQAEQLAPNAPDVRAARADLDKQKAAAGDKADADRIGVLIGQARAALAKDDFAAAETSLVAAEKIDAKAPAVVATRAELDKAKKKAGDQQASAEKVRALLAAAKRDAAAGKFAEADASLKQAEALEPSSADVKNARAELDKQMRADKAENDRVGALVGQAKAALAKNDLADAEKAIVAAEKIDAKAPTVVAVRADLDAAKKKAADQRASEEKVRALLAATKRDAAAGKFAEAEASLKQAEQLEPNSPDVKNARVELDKQMRADKAGNATPPGGKPAGPATGTAPATTGGTPPAATGGTLPSSANDKATADKATADKATADKVAALVAQARDAIKKRDFKTADTVLDQAEKLDAKAPDVIKARAELDAAEPGRRRNRQQQ